MYDDSKESTSGATATAEAGGGHLMGYLKSKPCLAFDLKNGVFGGQETNFLTSNDLAPLQLTSPELERIVFEPLPVHESGLIIDALRSTSKMVANDSAHMAPRNSALILDGLTSSPLEQLHQQQHYHHQQHQQHYHHHQQQQKPCPSIPATLTGLTVEDHQMAEPFTYATLTTVDSSRRQPVAPESSLASSTFISTDTSSPPGASKLGRGTGAPQTKPDHRPPPSASIDYDMLVPAAVRRGFSYLPRSLDLLKEEPQLVPRLGSTPPLSPINFDEQDRMKLERKREKNRMAARKCRTKKLEHIGQLEVCVRELKEQNRLLGETAVGLRMQMNRLQNQMAHHVHLGCSVLQLTDVDSKSF